MRVVACCFWEPSRRDPYALDGRPTRENEVSQRVALRASAAVTRPLLRTPAPTSEAKAPKLSIANDTHPSVVRCGCATHWIVIRPGAGRSASERRPAAWNSPPHRGLGKSTLNSNRDQDGFSSEMEVTPPEGAEK